MAEKKTVKKTEKKEVKKEVSKDLSVSELKVELQKVYLDVKTGKEKNSSLIKKLKKQIAKKLTTNSLTK